MVIWTTISNFDNPSCDPNTNCDFWSELWFGNQNRNFLIFWAKWGFCSQSLDRTIQIPVCTWGIVILQSKTQFCEFRREIAIAWSESRSRDPNHDFTIRITITQSESHFCDLAIQITIAWPKSWVRDWNRHHAIQVVILWWDLRFHD